MAEAALGEGDEQTFRIGGMSLAAKRWGLRGGRPILALHGWLDNCNSFAYLAPRLHDSDVVCLDGAGHGDSDSRNHLGAYNIWQDVAEIFAVADQLGWRQFSLLGHSRGGMVAFLAAGTFPARIDHLLMIEGACPRLARSQDAAGHLAESIRLLKACVQRPKTAYRSFGEAVKARENGLFPIAHADALVLAQHGVKPSADGFSWCYDPKLLAGSELKLNAEQVDSFYGRITARALLILAEGGLLARDEAFQRWLQPKVDWSVTTLEGGHHLHMSEHNEQVAEVINNHFLCGSHNTLKRS